MPASPAAAAPRQQQLQRRRRRARPRPIAAAATTAVAAALALLLPSAAAAAAVAFQCPPRTMATVGRPHPLPTVRPLALAGQQQRHQQQHERSRRKETWQRRGMVAVAAAADGGDGQQQPQQQEGPDDDDGFFGGSGLSTREALITGLGINPVTILLALAAIGMASANALYGPGWLRPSLGMKPTIFQSRNLVLPLDQEGMLFPLEGEGKGAAKDVWREWERD